MVIIYICELTMLPAVSSVSFHSHSGQTQRTQEFRLCKISNVVISWGSETGLRCLSPIRNKTEFYLNFSCCSHGFRVRPVKNVLENYHISHVFYIAIAYKLMLYNFSIIIIIIITMFLKG